MATTCATSADSGERRLLQPRQDVCWTAWVYNLVGTWSAQTLTPLTFRMHPFSPALYVDVDVDLYSSSFEALDWLFVNGIIQEGTIIGYDDWIHGGQHGQQAVHRDIVIKYNVTASVRCGGSKCHRYFHALPLQRGDALRCWQVKRFSSA